MVIERGLYHEPAAPPGYAWFAHDDEYLYVAIRNEVDPTKPLVATARWGKADSTELALRNPQGGQTAPILALRGYPDGRFESSAEAGAPGAVVQKAGAAVTFAAKVIDAASWVVEYRVPLDLLLAVPVSNGAQIECNISIRHSATATWVMWQGTGGLTWETGKAGLLELTE